MLEKLSLCRCDVKSLQAVGMGRASVLFNVCFLGLCYKSQLSVLVLVFVVVVVLLLS